MKDFKTVQEFFCNLHCVMCNSTFQPDGITLIKEEENYFVVNIKCMKCNQPVGIAVVSIVNQIDLHDIMKKGIPEININDELPPITCDDVIAAHKFFSSLGPDWMKHLKDFNKS